MTFYSNSVQRRITQLFEDNGISLTLNSNHMMTECSKDKIRSIVESIGFCPLISTNRVEGQFAFTVVPYQMPDFFTEAPYCIKEEIQELLSPHAFISEVDYVQDRWEGINFFRSYVLSTLNQALSEVIGKYAGKDQLILEVGSGVGYALADNLYENVVFTQPAFRECHLLDRSTSKRIYQTDIQGIYDCLKDSGKKLPLIFGLNVFDTMSPQLRKTSFLQINELQNVGDHLLLLLDTNPFLSPMIQLLESLYPNHCLFPYYPLTTECVKFSLLLVPDEYAPYKLTIEQMVEMVDYESDALEKGTRSRSQEELHELREKHNLKIIALEDFFAEQVERELAETGYSADVYYHASFMIRKKSEEFKGSISELLYKPVTDVLSLRT